MADITQINIEELGQYDVNVPDGKLTTPKYGNKSVTKEKLADEITGQLFEPLPTFGIKLTTSETEVADASYCVSDYYPCSRGDVIEWNAGEIDTTAALHTYNSTKQNVTDYFTNNATPRTVTLTSTSKEYAFIRFCFKKSFVGAYLKINGVLMYQWDGNESGQIIKGLKDKINVLDGQINGTTDVGLLYKSLEPLRDNMAYLANFSCMFFSDIHGSEDNFKRIVSLANKWKTRINAILNAGDTTQTTGVTTTGWYGTDIAQLSEVDVLTALGNHDVRLSNRSDVYNYIIKPTIDNVQNVVQPTGAAANYLCYYYKDYGTVRVIILDADNTNSYWDSDQNTWLANVLSDAKTQNLHVLIVNHASAEDITRIPCSFQSKYNLEGWHIVADAITTVQAFIDGGGKFVGWLCGHTHWDNFVYPVGYDSQAMFVTMSSRYNYGPNNFDVYRSGNPTEKNYDAFQMVSVDTTNTLLKIMRIGVNCDIEMKAKNILVYNYTTKEVISNY